MHSNKIQIFALVCGAMASSAHLSTAAIVATFDNFTTNTLANYTATNGYAISHSANGSPDFGDGANDGFLSVSVPASNLTGLLTYSLGTVDAGDIGKMLALTFRLDGRSANFHSDNVSFTSNGAVIAATTLSTSTFSEWDNGGTATTGLTMTDWRNRNGVGVLTYTIQAGDVGNTLGWRFASTSTSSGGFAFGVDNWNLAIVPEPSISALAALGVSLGLLRRRRI